MRRILPFVLALTVFTRMYDMGTNLSAVPMQRVSMTGQFGARYMGETRLRGFASFETDIGRWHQARFPVRLDGIFYHVGAQFDITPALMLEAKHGSWHSIDQRGHVEHYNYIGLEAKL